MRILNTRGDTNFWQWDTGRKLVILGDEDNCGEAHFCTGNGDPFPVAIRMEEGLRVVDVPDEVLQMARPFTVYLIRTEAGGDLTRHAQRFNVFPKTKPADYIHTPSERQTWEQLDERIEVLEQNGSGGVSEEQIADAVEAYMTTHPIDPGVDEQEIRDIVDEYLAENLTPDAPDSGQNPPQDGEDGFSPIATVTQTADGATITITDKNGTTTATVTNGKDGKDGVDGQDGYTPQKGVDYFDGLPGKDGTDGKDGYTPVKDKDYFDGKDGQDGSPGKDGNGIKSAVLNADYTLTLTFDNGSTYTTPSIRGATGATGSAGKDGPTGAAGKNGTDGVGIESIKQTTTSTADDGNNVFTVTLTNGTSVTFTVKNGSKGSTGSAGKDGSDGQPGVPGTPGADGYTPVRGKDYWTPTDKAEIEAFIATELAKRGQLRPETAESLEWLAENGDKSLVYALPNGNMCMWLLTEKEVSTGGGYTNALDERPLILNRRWSHSSKKLSDALGYATTDIIPVVADQTVYVNRPYEFGKNGVFTGNYPRVTYYDASGNYVAGEMDRLINQKVVLTCENDVTSFVVGYTMTTSGDPTTNTRLAGADDIVGMRMVLQINDGTAITEDDVSDIIISVGNPIVEGGTEIVKEYAWVETGLNITPADYEPRIIAVEKTASNNTARIVALEKSVESGGADENEAAALSKIQKWDKPVYDPAPVTLIADDRVKPALTTSDRTIDAIHAKYRALMAAHPNYITETNMGKSSASDTFAAVDMLRFDFCEPGGLTQPDMAESGRHETKPTLIFLSGIHTEWVGVWGLYYALEEITTNPDFDDVRRNARIIVIPCANPYCLAWETSVDGWRMSHVNANGVAIHNNFGVNHSTSGSVGEYNYGGTAPYSEPETQYIDAVMAEFPDAVAFVSCHNNDYSTYYGSHVIWASSATYHMCNVAFRLVDKLTKAWLNKYGQTLKDAIDQYKINMDANDYRLGRATMSTSKGTEQLNATKYGIMGVNLEIARMMKVFSGNTDGTSEVTTHGAEVYANFMRTLLWNYDHKDKKEYAPNLPWED